MNIFVTGDDAESVIDIGTNYLRIIGPTFLFLGVFRIINDAFKSSRNTGTSMGLSILSLWVFRYPVAYVLLVVIGTGAVGVWYAIAFSNVASAVVMATWFLRGTWATSVVESDKETAEVLEPDDVPPERPAVLRPAKPIASPNTSIRLSAVSI